MYSSVVYAPVQLQPKAGHAKTWGKPLVSQTVNRIVRSVVIAKQTCDGVLEDASQAQGDDQHHDATDAVDELPALGLYWAWVFWVGAVAAEESEDAQH